MANSWFDSNACQPDFMAQDDKGNFGMATAYKAEVDMAEGSVTYLNSQGQPCAGLSDLQSEEAQVLHDKHHGY